MQAKDMRTVEEFIATQRDWLGRLYPRGHDRSSGTPAEPILDPKSTQWNIVEIFNDLLDSRLEPSTAAQDLSDLILSDPDFMTPYNNMWGCFFNAAEFFTSTEKLSTLADLLAHLASLPDATNQRQEPMVVHSSKTTTIQPGELVVVQWAGRKEQLWSDLPCMALCLRERFNGPEAYLSRGDPPKTARSVWRNINTFVAILIRDHVAGLPTLFEPFIEHAFLTLADALEHPPQSRLGRNATLHLPAACQWILLARAEVYNAVKVGFKGKPWKVRAGQLWCREGGTVDVDESRWLFWKRRFEELGEDARLDVGTIEESAKAKSYM